MAALRRWWKKWRNGRWLHDDVEEFLRRRSQGQAAAPSAVVSEWLASRDVAPPRTRDDAARLLT
eukprot:3894497-Alexandrium_andersonii.AAC.1